MSKRKRKPGGNQDRQLQKLILVTALVELINSLVDLIGKLIE